MKFTDKSLKLFLESFKNNQDIKPKAAHSEVVNHLEESNKDIGLRIKGPRLDVEVYRDPIFIRDSTGLYLGILIQSPFVLVHDFAVNLRKLAAACLHSDQNHKLANFDYMDLKGSDARCPFCDEIVLNFIDGDCGVVGITGRLHECFEREDFAMSYYEDYIFLDANKVDSDSLKTFLSLYDRFLWTEESR